MTCRPVQLMQCWGFECERENKRARKKTNGNRSTRRGEACTCSIRTWSSSSINRKTKSAILYPICVSPLDEWSDEEFSEEFLRLHESSNDSEVFSSEEKSTDSGISTDYSSDSSSQSSSEEKGDGSVCFRWDTIGRIKDSSERSTERYEQGA